MRVIDMSKDQLENYIKDNYSFKTFLELLDYRTILDGINKLEDIYEDHDNE